MRQLHSHRSSERDWEKVRMILATQYNAVPGKRRRVKPKDMVKLDIDAKRVRYERDQELIEQALRAWQPIKAEA